MTTFLSGGHLIDGRMLVSSGERFFAVNPSTGETLEPGFAAATNAEVNAAMDAAKDAFAVMRELSWDRRVTLLEAIGTEIINLGDALLNRAHEETGLTLKRLESERARTLFQLKHFSETLREGSWVDAAIDTGDTCRLPSPKPDLRRMLRPIGPVVVFGAGNFPFAYGACGGDTASALAAGNPVVVKAHEKHPGTNELFAHATRAALDKCGLPRNIFGLLHGPGTTVGQSLVRHPAVCAVGFTGSHRAGRALADIGAARSKPIPVFAEMGSLNPVILLPGALAERWEVIAAALAHSITSEAGQFCTKPGLIFLLDSPVADTFISRLVSCMAEAPFVTMLNAELRRNFCAMTDALVEIPGVRVRLKNDPCSFAGMTPRLYETESSTWRAHRTLCEEAFGPASIIVRCRDLDDLLATVPLVSGSLAAALHTGRGDDDAGIRTTARMLEQIAGRLIYNGFPTGVEVCCAMVHGGPYPATTMPGTSSVGSLAMRRFVRPVAFQNAPDALLPEELRNANRRGIWRTVNGRLTQNAI